jgi:phosphatidylserine/phosphatidylglycerophosphate/cardiolipin synthase-like enzyme
MSGATSLLDVPVHELEVLARAVAAGRLRAPVTELGLRTEGLHALLPHLGQLERFPDHRSLVIAVELVHEAACRHARRPRPQVVWSGPEPTEGRARLTGVVLPQLFERARMEVFIAGYAFEAGEAVLQPLYTAMVEHGVSTEIVLDCSREKVYGSMLPDTLLDKVVERFFSSVWTFGEPRPTLYYDPRTLVREPSRFDGELFPPVSMHAKCVIVDRRHVLVGSANFTRRAQARNIEVGALLEDEGFAEGLLFQWRAAMGHGFVVRA